jgi:hypothetical protein
MRALIACVLLAACATDASLQTPPARLAGCWVNRDAGAAIMRWLPDATRAGVLQGVKTTVGINGQRSDRFTLEPEGEGWKLCRTGDNATCWGVAQGDGGSLEGGRAFIDTAGDNVRITVAGDGPERLIFQGRRDSCN